MTFIPENQSRASFFIYVNRIIYIMENIIINSNVTLKNKQDNPTLTGRTARHPTLAI
jgi:hypothetical protein